MWLYNYMYLGSFECLLASPYLENSLTETKVNCSTLIYLNIFPILTFPFLPSSCLFFSDGSESNSSSLCRMRPCQYHLYNALVSEISDRCPSILYA